MIPYLINTKDGHSSIGSQLDGMNLRGEEVIDASSRGIKCPSGLHIQTLVHFTGLVSRIEVGDYIGGVVTRVLC